MKTRPTCNRTYSDEAPGFCPQDGAHLVGGLPADSPQQPTANVPAPQTSAVPPSNQQAYVQPPAQVPTVPRRLPHNTMRRWVKISHIILIVSVVLLIVALATRVNSRRSNPVPVLAATFGGVGLLVGIIGHFSYGKQAATIDEMFRQAGNSDAMFTGGSLLAHWAYSPQEWGQFVQSEVARNRKANVVVLCIIGLVFLFTASFLISGGSRSGGDIEGVLICLTIFAGVGLFAWRFATADARNLKACNTGEAFISRTGLLLNDRYYPWNVTGMRLTGVFFEPGNPNVVRFDYQQWGGRAVGGAVVPTKNDKSVRVPVPFGHEAEAQNLAANFQR